MSNFHWICYGYSNLRECFQVEIIKLSILQDLQDEYNLTVKEYEGEGITMLKLLNMHDEIMHRGNTKLEAIDGHKIN